MKQTKSYRIMAVSVLAMVTLLWGMFCSCEIVSAETGSISSCSITRYYRHPVSGEIEDSGGESSFATGQGMIEGCINSTGMLEKTDDGRFYLSFRLSLADYTSDISFKTQTWGASGWTSADVWKTGSGSDSQGATTDYCMQVPGKDCIIRGSMYVEPMGRNVIFYFAPSGYSEGNTAGFSPQVVTETAEEDSQKKEVSSPEEEKKDSSSVNRKSETDAENEQTKQPEKEKKEDAVEKVEQAIDDIGKVSGKSEEKIKAARKAYNALSDEEKERVSNIETLIKAEKRLSEIQTAEIEMPSTESTLKAAGGLSLSTAKEDVPAEKDNHGDRGKSIAAVIGIIVLAGAISGGVYFAKKNKKGKGDTRDDDE